MAAAARLVRAASLVLAAACSSSPSLPGFGRQASTDGLGALERAGLSRSIAPQLSIAVRYRPCGADARSQILEMPATCGSPGSAGSPDIVGLAVRSSDALRTRVDMEALHTTALLDILWAEPMGKALDRSISSLTTVARVSGRPARPLADLSAALLVRAIRDRAPEDLLAAIEVASEALAVEPRSAPARYNLALALDRSGLEDQASDAWRAYLELDSISGWADEVRQRLAALNLSAPPAPPPWSATDQVLAEYVRHAPHEALLEGWNNVLGEWANAALREDSAPASTALRHAGRLGQALHQQGGDATLADAVLSIDAAAGRMERLLTLARAHAAYSTAERAYAAADFGAAGRAYRAALRDSRGSPPLAAWASLGIAGTLVQNNRMGAAALGFRTVAAEADHRRYPVLAGRAWWGVGTAELRRGRFDPALRAYQRAAELFETEGLIEYLGAARYLAAETQFVMGDAQAANAAMHGALVTLRGRRNSVWRYLLLESWGSTLAPGHPRAALQIAGESVRNAARTRRPNYVAGARLVRAELRAAAGDQHGALEDVNAAGSLVAQLPPGATRDWLQANRQLVASRIATGSPPTSFMLDSALAFYRAAHNPSWLVPALLLRARLSLRLGNVGAAEADLDDAFVLLDRESSALESTGARARLLDAAREVIDQIVMLKIARHRAGDALARLEQGRVSHAGRPAAALPAVDVQVPGDRTIIDYALVGDTLLAWTIAGGGLELTRLQVDRTELLRAIDLVRASLELGTAQPSNLSHLALLYDRLIRPIGGRLRRSGASLVVIADGEIAAVPFAALYDSARGRYLVEDHDLRYAGTLSEALVPHPVERRGAKSALLIADPTFSPTEHPGLERLPYAAAEVAGIASGYPSSTVLAGPAAGYRDIVARLPGADVVHYAGHAVFDDARPERSALVLAASPRSGPTRLTAEDIESLDLRRVQLVVLSACRSAPALHTRSGGLAGISRSLLAAGVHGVLGSLWQVKDDLTLPLMTAFHERYRAGADPAAALRDAQLALLRSSDSELRSPSAWGGFRYAGK